MSDKQIQELANQILDYARNKLLVNLRFMNVALSYHERKEYTGLLATNGRELFYDPIPLLKMYRNSIEEFVHLYLHLILHCVFMHPFVGIRIEQRLWNLAADIAVENTIRELSVSGIKTTRVNKQLVVIDELKNELKLLTAEKIYAWLKRTNQPEYLISSWEEIFRFDDHQLWYIWMLKITTGITEVQEADQDDKGVLFVGMEYQEAADFWKKMAEQIQMDLETFGRQQGNSAGNFIQNLREVNREKYDYRAFLKRFAVLGETMKVNEDEFDYIYYTYGLNHYKKMPLIEPLEYKEVKRIKEFVIAIDTSGSVAGDEVQQFLQKTYNILKSEESFFSKINIHIIQCDADIQEDAIITNQEEFDNYIKSMVLRGLGGTDFRPVFSYVDKLVENREFKNLRGMLYFTDGEGIFPNYKPAYKTAFVFISDDYHVPKVPPWAIKLVLQHEDIL